MQLYNTNSYSELRITKNRTELLLITGVLFRERSNEQSSLLRELLRQRRTSQKQKSSVKYFVFNRFRIAQRANDVFN